MLGLLFLVPALLGAALLIDSNRDSDDDNDPAVDDQETTTLGPEDENFTGTDISDIIIGNDLPNGLSGMGGNDQIQGGDGNDSLNGGAGNDLLQGGNGDDEIAGGSGEDNIYAAAGDDTVNGGAGNDRVFLGDGEDEFGLTNGRDAGDDFIRGGADDDTIRAIQGSNEIFGDKGNDTILAVDGLQLDDTFDPAEFGTPDTLNGGTDADTLYGDDGDQMTGGTGADAFVVATTEARDQESVLITDFNTDVDTLSLVDFADGDGTDITDLTFEFDAEENAVRAFYLTDEIAVLAGLEEADIPNITVLSVLDDSEEPTDPPVEPKVPVVSGKTILGPDQDNFNGTVGNDTVVGNDNANDLFAFGGNDRIDGQGGNDSIDGGRGEDLLQGRDGDDVIKGRNGDDNIFGGAGDDTVTGGKGNDNVFLGDGDDEYLGANGEDAGDDFIRGGADEDLIADTRGSNVIMGDLGDDTINAVDGLQEDNTLDPTEKHTTDTLSGGFGDDALFGDDGDAMTGGAGKDAFNVVTTDTHEQESVLITDFNTEEDVFVVANIAPDADSDETDVTFQYDAEADVVRAIFKLRELAIFEGLEETDISNISVSVIDSSLSANA